jgi:hypothetical protein
LVQADGWNGDIEMMFEARLRRARDKVQPLKIQAALLAETRPEIALRLLDRYFDSGDTLFLADAYSIQARARVAAGDIAGAAQSYVAALTREVEFPNLKSNSFVEYPLLVAEHGLTERYSDAVRVLTERQPDVAFPLHRFMWHAAHALILLAQGECSKAKTEARLALAAADQSSSGFRYHQSIGLVGSAYPELLDRLRRVSA